MLEPWSAVALCYLLGNFAGCCVIWSPGCLRKRIHPEQVTQDRAAVALSSARERSSEIHDSAVLGAEGDCCDPGWEKK